MIKSGLINKLVITNKTDTPYYSSNISKDLNILGDILSEKFGITKKNVFLGSNSDEVEFITSIPDECEIYFKDDINQILDIISYSQQVEGTLPEHEYVEFDYDEYDDLLDNKSYEDDDFEI